MSETLPAEPTQLLSAESKKIVAATAQSSPSTPSRSPPVLPTHVRRASGAAAGVQPGQPGHRGAEPGAGGVGGRLRRPADRPGRALVRPRHEDASPTSTSPWVSGPSSTRSSATTCSAAVGEVLGDAVTPEVARGVERGVLALRHPAHRRGGPAVPAGADRPGAPLRPYRSVRRIEETADVVSLRPGAGRRRRAAGDRSRPVRVGVRRPPGRASPAPPVHGLLDRVGDTGCRSPSAGCAGRTAPRTAGVVVPARHVAGRRHARGQRPGRRLRRPAVGRPAAAGQRGRRDHHGAADRRTHRPHPTPTQGHRRARRPDRPGPRIARDRAARRSADRRLHRLHLVRVVHFLAADASGYITGQGWGVNGGLDM